MRSSPGGGVAITVLLTAGFASVGELATGPAIRSLAAWNESFLTGAGVAGALLFPLSLLFHHAALRIELGLLGIGLVCHGRSAIPRGTADAATPRVRRRSDAVEPLLLLGVLAAAVAFVALDLRYNLLWDGLLIWASKAQVLFHEGFLTRLVSRRPLRAAAPDLSAARPAVRGPAQPDPGTLRLRRGQADFHSVLPLVPDLDVRGRAVRRVEAARLASTLILALVPSLATARRRRGVRGHAAGGVRRGRRRRRLPPREDRAALPWILGGLTTVKAEGTILALGRVAAVVLVAGCSDSQRSGPPAGGSGGTPRSSRHFSPSGSSSCAGSPCPDLVYVPLDAAHFAEAFGRIPRVRTSVSSRRSAPGGGDCFWPRSRRCRGRPPRPRIGPREGLARRRSGRGRPRATVPFLLTTWPLELQIDQAYPRLLAQVAPAAAVVLVFGYVRATAAAARHELRSRSALRPKRRPFCSPLWRWSSTGPS